MPRKFIRKLLPTHGDVVRNRFLRPFSALLHDPALLALNRRSVAKAAAIGLFWAFIPIPGQGVIAIANALWLRVNILVAYTMSWVTNPFTAGPIVLAAYKIGAAVLGPAPGQLQLEWSVDFLVQGLGRVWAPFLLGSVLLGTAVGALGYFTINGLWLVSVRRRFQRRRNAPLKPPPPAP